MTDPELPDDPATGADGEGAPANADAAATGQPQGDSLEQRIQSDPAFALEQYKKVKGESTKLYQKNKAYEAITRIADQLGGADVAAQLLSEYAAVAQSAEVARVREHYRTHGTLPTTSSTRTDDTTDDDVYKDPQTVEIENLKRQLAELTNTVSHTRGIIGKQSVSQMLTRLKTERPDGFDEFVLPALESKFAELERSAQGREVLANLNYDQLQAISGKAIAENFDAIADLRHQRILDGKKRVATGAPAQNMSNGREPAASKGFRNAMEVIAEFRREHGTNYG